MPGSAWRFVAVLFCLSVLWISSTPTVKAQLKITSLADDQSAPSVIARPVLEDEQASESAPVQDNPETLKQRLKDIEDRLRAYETENDALRRRNELKQSTVQTLTESLAISNAERELLSRNYNDLKTRMEALGLASVGDNKEALQQRLLKSVNDLRLLREERNRLAEGMMGLTESILLYMKTSTNSDPQLRLQIEAQIRATSEVVDASNSNEALGNTPVEGNLKEGRIISVKEEFSLVVINLGRLQGAKPGTPFQIVRGDKYVGRGRVVDVRERISGLVVEDYSSNTEKVKVGDTVRVDVQP